MLGTGSLDSDQGTGILVLHCGTSSRRLNRSIEPALHQNMFREVAGLSGGLRCVGDGFTSTAPRFSGACRAGCWPSFSAT